VASMIRGRSSDRGPIGVAFSWDVREAGIRRLKQTFPHMDIVVPSLGSASPCATARIVTTYR
jgi:hypothetical protein